MRLLFFAALVSASLFAQQPDPAAARKAAEAWLPLVDAGKYGESWAQAAGPFRSAVTKEQWIAAAAQARGPLGRLSSRRFTLAQHLTDPPNSAPGEYFLLQYEADFQNRNGATETAVMLHQDKKVWKLAGYFVK